jgi:glycosyltransferase involved in cell wall biosynthesis
VPSKRASSPTKYGEYLATGLPVVVDSWTGDVNLIAHSEAIITVNGFQDAEFVAAAETLAQRLRTPEATSRAARALAEREFRLEDAVERYDRMYRVLTGRRPDRALSCPGLSTAGHTTEPAR